MREDIVSAVEAVLPHGSALPTTEVGEWSVGGATPDVVVCPRTPEQVASVLALATAEGWSVWPAGIGTWLAGTPHSEEGRATIVLSTRRMDRIVEYEPADLTITAEAGVTLEEIQRATNAEGQWLPMDPRPDDRGTLGGTLATASAGPLAPLFGAPRDLCLGLELITGDGRRLTVGGRVVKNVAGFDLVRLAVGSWGALGVIVGVTVRLFPRPAVDRTLITRGAERDVLFAVARKIATGPVDVAGLELLDPGLEPSDSGPDPSNQARLVLRLIGSSAEVDAVADEIASGTGQVRWSTLDETDSDRARVRLRAWDREAPIAFRIVALPSRLTEITPLLESFQENWDRREGPVRLTFAADVVGGRVRVGVHPTGPATVETRAELIAALRSAAERLGGTLRILRCDPALSRHVAAWSTSPSETRLVRGLLDAFDPAGVLPGKRFGR